MLMFLIAATLAIGQTDLDRDEEIVFYPVYASRGDDGLWRAAVRGWIFETDSAPVVVESLCKRFEILASTELSPEEKKLLIERAAPFLVDNERNQRVAIRLADRTLTSEPSEKNGHFLVPVMLQDQQLTLLRSRGELADTWLRYSAIVKPGDGRIPRGEIQFIPTAGLSVISDIDDTIKITNVRDKKKLMENTFLKPFMPVPGMADLYRSWAARPNTVFHYVSANPYQLYRPLREFIDAEHFPAGTYFLKSFRAKDSSLLEFLGKQDDFKTRMIQPILADFPFRKFILVGDSGEQDPEIYAALARQNPMQIEHIYIRNVTAEPATAPRYAKTFQGVEQTIWTVFEDPSSLSPTSSEKLSR